MTSADSGQREEAAGPRVFPAAVTAMWWIRDLPCPVACGSAGGPGRSCRAMCHRWSSRCRSSCLRSPLALPDATLCRSASAFTSPISPIPLVGAGRRHGTGLRLFAKPSVAGGLGVCVDAGADGPRLWRRDVPARGRRHQGLVSGPADGCPPPAGPALPAQRVFHLRDRRRPGTDHRGIRNGHLAHRRQLARPAVLEQPQSPRGAADDRAEHLLPLIQPRIPLRPQIRGRPDSAAVSSQATSDGVGTRWPSTFPKCRDERVGPGGERLIHHRGRAGRQKLQQPAAEAEHLIGLLQLLRHDPACSQYPRPAQYLRPPADRRQRKQAQPSAVALPWPFR